MAAGNRQQLDLLLRDCQKWLLLGKAAKGTFYFDHKGAARQDLNSHYKVCTVDGDGNRSECVAASEVAGEPETYRPLGEFGPAQSASQWRYEESADKGSFWEMSWDPGGYEGRWTGSGAARIGRIWMQPSASTDVSRTFLVPADAVLTIAGEVRRTQAQTINALSPPGSFLTTA